MKQSIFVPPSGNPNSPCLAIVGEQNGEVELKMRQPFVGPTGRELEKIFRELRITRNEIYLTNTFKYGSSLNMYLNMVKNKPVLTPLGTEQINLLKDELSKVKPRAIVVLGNVALYALTGEWGITKYRGSIFKQPFGTVVASIHPATILRGEPENKYLITLDMEKAMRVSKGYKEREPNIFIKPTFNQALDFIDYCMSQESVSYDIETTGRRGYKTQLSCISFSTEKDVMSIPFLGEGNINYFTQEEEATIMEAIDKLLSNPDIEKVGQNLMFDAYFMHWLYRIIPKNLQDTMIAQKILMPEFRKGLDFISSIFMDMRYYKDDGKEFTPGKIKDFQQLWRYNAMDSYVCSQAFPAQKTLLINQGNWETYQYQVKLIEPLMMTTFKGIYVDQKRMSDEFLRMKAESVQLKIKLLEIALSKGAKPDKVDNKMASSHKQLSYYFYDVLRLRKYKTKARTDGFDDIVLNRYIANNIEEASIIQKIRELTKLSKTYLDPMKIDDDSRIRCSYDISGTRFSRLSSSKNLFGTGTNMQNWPHELLIYLKPDKGHIYCSFDLAQAENRIVAYTANCLPMMEAFETGKDMHKRTAALIFKKPEDLISDVSGSAVLGGVATRFSERAIGKKANHGLNYKESPNGFAVINAMTLKEATLVHNTYHKVYPEISRAFWGYCNESLIKNGCITNLLGRVTVFHGDRSSEEVRRKAYSCIPQGTVGDLMNRYGILYLYHFMDITPMNQIHDSLGFQLPLTLSWTCIAQRLIMIKANLEKELTCPNKNVFTIPADLTVGKTLRKENEKGKAPIAFELKGKKMSSNVNELSELLEAKWKDLEE